MTIKLDSISVKHIGPIGEFKQHFSSVNLIYGKNEQGKTFIVEYLLSTIFKNKAKGRSTIENGQVNISGLKSELLHLAPNSKQKLEDHIFDSNEKNQPDLSRLTVVKGGDLSFEGGSRNSVNFQIIKGYLSDQKTFEKVSDRINEKKNILKCSIVDGQVLAGDRIGEVKSMLDWEQKIIKIDASLRNITENSSAIKLTQLNDHKNYLENEIESQEKAKRYYGFQLKQKIEQLDAELQKYPVDVLFKLKSCIQEQQTQQEKLEKRRAELSTLRNGSNQLEWLQVALADLEKFGEKSNSNNLSTPLLMLLILTVLLIPILIYFNISALAYLASGLAFLVAILFSLSNSASRSADHQSDREEILRDFSSRFNIPNPSIASIRDERERQTKNKTLAVEKETSYSEINQELQANKTMERELTNKLQARGGIISPLSILTIENKLFELEKINVDHKATTGELASLKLDLSELSSEKCDVVFNASKLCEFQNELETAKGDIEKEKEKISRVLNDAKAELSGNHFESKLDQVIDELRSLRNEKMQDLVAIRAKIFAYLSIKSALDDKAEKENEIIQQSFESSGISPILQKVTSKYTRVVLEENAVSVTDGINVFRLDELSTGTQEQVLLSIRLGLLNHVLHGQKSFLILDDAFQHSDWDRRENLIQVVSDLVNDGWQVIYFTMDDHIRSLFEDHIKPTFQDRYQLIDLGVL